MTFCCCIQKSCAFAIVFFCFGFICILGNTGSLEQGITHETTGMNMNRLVYMLKAFFCFCKKKVNKDQVSQKIINANNK